MRRLTLLAAATTRSQRDARFPVDEGIDPDLTLDRRPTSDLPHDTCLHGPERRCAETARALGLASSTLAALRAWDLGSWAGRDVAEIGTRDPASLDSWRRDPNAAPHGGETLTQLLARIASWMEAPTPDGRVVVVVDASVVRAAVVHAVQAGPNTFWHLDVLPISSTLLTRGHGEWRARYVGAPLVPLDHLDGDGEA